ncbi:nicotinate-nucleotide adenylyltransferase [bacterium]|nr:nicotinate-nucleotide adenylyltransferase [bacterium]MBU1754535.1 nicotinate-nucleotide adenylyltransferase [bacterium]
MATRIGILGGTFNPIHNGHLLIAETARQFCCLEKVVFIPCFIPPHKETGDKDSPESRYAMTTLAVAEYPDFMISPIEIERKGKSYSRDTIQEIKIKYGSGTSIYFIAGTDTIAELNIWKDIDELLSLCRFIAVSRPGYSLNIPEKYEEKIDIINITGMDISSSEIRKRLSNHESICGLVPECVEKYIYEYGLYQ